MSLSFVSLTILLTFSLLLPLSLSFFASTSLSLPRALLLSLAPFLSAWLSLFSSSHVSLSSSASCLFSLDRSFSSFSSSPLFFSLLLLSSYFFRCVSLPVSLFSFSPPRSVICFLLCCLQFLPLFFSHHIEAKCEKKLPHCDSSSETRTRLSQPHHGALWSQIRQKSSLARRKR